MIHYARCRIVGPEQVREYTALCGSSVMNEWTINPSLVTCERCKRLTPLFVPRWIQIMKNFSPL